MKIYAFPIFTGMVVSFCWVWLFLFWAGNIDVPLYSFLFNSFGIRLLALVSNILFSAFAAILFAFPVFAACKAGLAKGMVIFVGSYVVSFLVIQYMGNPEFGVLSNIAFVFSLDPFSPILMFVMLLSLCVYLISRVSRARKAYA